MNIFAKVTMEALKKNKTRTIVTIIGVILSATMICASTTFASSMQNFLLRCEIYNEGDWHGAVYDAKYTDYEKIGTSEKVSSATYAQVLGYAKINSAYERKPYMYVLGGDVESGCFNTLPVHIILGRLPKNTSEIILPEHLSTNGKVDYKIGDIITLSVGDRTLDGVKLGQNIPLYNYDGESQTEEISDEKIENATKRTFTVVGIYEKPSFEEYTAPGFTGITVSDSSNKDKTPVHCYFKMKKPASVYDFMKESGFSEKYSCGFNTKVLLYSGVTQLDTFLKAFYGLAAVVILLIVFGSVSLIYNAFSISVSERTRQYGLLSSVGATKKQLRRMVFFEALYVSAIGIPLGIIAGIGGIAVTLLLIGDKFGSLIRSGIPMRICVSREAVLAAAVIALVTVLISAWIPSKRAAKVSAVEAIRQNTDIKADNKPVKTSRLTYKLFGLPGVIAGKHYKRSRKKYRTTVVSLFMSVVLFVSASAFTSYMTETAEGGIGSDPFDLIYVAEASDTDKMSPNKILDILLSDKNITGGTYGKKQFLQGDISRKYVTDIFAKRFADFAAESEEADSDSIELTSENEKKDPDSLGISGFISFVADREFNKLLAKYNLNESDYYDRKNPLGIALGINTQFDRRLEKFVTVETLRGDECVILCLSISY